jgi:hypothetical protein
MNSGTRGLEPEPEDSAKVDLPGVPCPEVPEERREDLLIVEGVDDVQSHSPGPLYIPPWLSDCVDSAMKPVIT